MNIFFAVILNIFLISSVFANRSDELNYWVQSNIINGEEIICQRENNNDYFFVARSGERLKTGYRLDVTSSDDTAKNFIISWRFKNEKGDYIGRNTPPEVVTQKSFRDGKYAYAEEISYYYVYEISKPLDVTVGLRKYAMGTDMPSDKVLPDSELLDVVHCKE